MDQFNDNNTDSTQQPQQQQQSQKLSTWQLGAPSITAQPGADDYKQQVEDYARAINVQGGPDY